VGSIFLLALAAAVYPQLLAVVVIILTRPNPQPLLWACYLASLLVSIGSSVLIFAVFQSRGLLERDRQARRCAARRPAPGSATAAKTRARAERALSEGSVVVACVVGAVLALPGPFDLVALGRLALARGGYGLIAAAGAMVVFAVIKFVLIEVPIAGYAIDRDGTAVSVDRFSRWMHTNEFAAVAAIAGVFGIALIGRGISALG
jgi:hypothetical protein